MVLSDKLQEYFKEEDFKIRWDLRWRVCVDFYEDADVLLERNEVDRKLVILSKELVYIK